MFRLDGTPWMTPGEREEAIAEMLAARIIMHDNRHELPTKSGQKTDIYINLREVRNTPSAMRFFGDAYANAIRRLHVQRIVEVPEAISPIAGYTSAVSGIPLVTVRGEVKAGRATSGLFIGNVSPGDNVAIMDDVITDGASKISALTELRNAGANLAAQVVLVDRQQGWRQKLAAAGFDGRVWAAMTLHDVRRYLIEHGLMQRCDPVAEAKNPIIVALDGKTWDEILPLLDLLRTSGCILKVNDLLLYEGIKRLLPDLSIYGNVMADIKGHDIKNTLENISAHFGACPPWAITVHASGGAEMIRAARAKLDAVGAKKTKILAVTVLTSIDIPTCQEVYHCRPVEEVMALAKIVATAGADGFVCSAKPEEVGGLSVSYPGKTLVTPGVRSPGADPGDQSRVDTPKNAMANGANFLVMGRQILGAADPVAEVKRVMTAELGITV